MSISDAIKAEIERQGLSASAVARRAGVAPNVVSRFLSGERDIQLGTADKIATALGLVLIRKNELPDRDHPGVTQAESGDTTVRTIGTGPQARELMIRLARPEDDTEFAWVLCFNGEPNEFSDDSRELESSVREWIDIANAE